MVEIDAPCLDCGEPMHLEIKDGKVIKTTPADITAYVAVPFSQWMARLPHA